MCLWIQQSVGFFCCFFTWRCRTAQSAIFVGCRCTCLILDIKARASSCFFPHFRSFTVNNFDGVCFSVTEPCEEPPWQFSLRPCLFFWFSYYLSWIEQMVAKTLIKYCVKFLPDFLQRDRSHPCTPLIYHKKYGMLEDIMQIGNLKKNQLLFWFFVSLIFISDMDYQQN